MAHAFRFLMQQTRKLHGISCRLKTDEVVDQIENRKLATNLYHVIQEAIKNAITHGEAGEIEVSVTKPENDIVINIEDDGVGFSHSSGGKDGKGLRIMKHRIELMGGSFEIEDKSEAGSQSGTIVRCVVPYENLTENE